MGLTSEVRGWLREPGVGGALVGFVCVRVVVWLAAWIGAPDASHAPEGAWRTDVPLVRWDSGYYRCILVDGYPPGPPVPERVAFYPLYPLLASPLARYLDRDVALVVVSNAAALLGAALLFAWAQRLTDRRAAWWCVMLASAYPPAMFLSAGYTEGVFFLEVAAALWLLARRQPLLSACVCGLASATRPTGLVLAAVVFLWTWLHGQGRRPTRRLVHLLAVGAVSISGFVVYHAHLWHRYGRPDASFAVQDKWRSETVTHPWIKALTLQPVLEPALRPIKYAVRGQFDRLRQPRYWNSLLALVMLALGVGGLVRPGGMPRVLFLLPVGIFLMAYLPDPSGGSYLVSAARFQTAALPCFLLVATWRWWQRHRATLALLIAAQVVLQCLYAWTFAQWQWAG